MPFYTIHETRVLSKRYLNFDLTHLQIALRREKPGGSSVSRQDVSKMGSLSDDEDDTSSFDTIDSFFPAPKNYDPAPDVSSHL